MAGLIDLGVVAVLGGLLLLIFTGFQVGRQPALSDLATHLLQAGLVAVAGTLVLSCFEASPLEATPGKLACGLRLRRDSDSGHLGLGRAIVRNLFKLGLPVPLAYLAALAAYDGGGWPAWVGVGAAAVVAASYLAGVLLGDGRPVYDQLAGSAVIRTAPGRRYA